MNSGCWCIRLHGRSLLGRCGFIQSDDIAARAVTHDAHARLAGEQSDERSDVVGTKDPGDGLLLQRRAADLDSRHVVAIELLRDLAQRAVSKYQLPLGPG